MAAVSVKRSITMQVVKTSFEIQDCSLAVPCGPWHLFFVPRQSESQFTHRNHMPGTLVNFSQKQPWISIKIMYREYLPHQINPHNPISKLERVTGFDSIKSDAGFVDASDQGGQITPISLALTLFCHVLLPLSELHDNSSQSKVNKSVGNCITHGSHEVAKQSVMLLWS